MILPLNPTLANILSREFVNGEVKKEYIARCKGEFTECVSSQFASYNTDVRQGKRLRAKSPF